MVVKSPIRVVILVVPHDGQGTERMSPLGMKVGKLCLGICGGTSTSPPFGGPQRPVTKWRSRGDHPRVYRGSIHK